MNFSALPSSSVSSPSPMRALARFLGSSLLIAGLLLVGITVGISWWLWFVLQGAVMELADGTQMQPLLRETLLRLGQAAVLAGAGYFLTLNLRRWHTGMIRIWLGLSAVPCAILLVSLVTDRGVDGLPLSQSQVDPAAVEWFDGKSGEPALWWGRGDGAAPDFFHRPGHHPRTGVKLQPVDPGMRRAWMEEQAAAVRCRAAAAQSKADALAQAARSKAEAEARDADHLAAESLRAAAEKEARELRATAEQDADRIRAEAALEASQAETRRREALALEEATKQVAVASDSAPAGRIMSDSGSNNEPGALADGSATPPAKSSSIPLRAGAVLRVPVRGDRVHVSSDGPVAVAADGHDWENVWDGRRGLVFPASQETIHIRPLNDSATMVVIRKL